jgi:hypothetical protein
MDGAGQSGILPQRMRTAECRGRERGRRGDDVGNGKREKRRVERVFTQHTLTHTQGQWLRNALARQCNVAARTGSTVPHSRTVHGEHIRHSTHRRTWGGRVGEKQKA